MIFTIVYWALVSIEFIQARDLRQYIPRVDEVPMVIEEYQYKNPNDEVRLILDSQPIGYDFKSTSNNFPYFIENQPKFTQITQFNQPVNNYQNIIFTLINDELKKHPMFNYNYILNLVNNQLKIQPNININDLQFLIDRQLQNIENQHVFNQQPGFVFNYEMQGHPSQFTQIQQKPKVNIGYQNIYNQDSNIVIHGQRPIPTNDIKKPASKNINNSYQGENLQNGIFFIINEEMKKHPNAKYDDILLLIEDQIKRQPNINMDNLRVLISNQLENLYDTNNVEVEVRNQDPAMFFTDETNLNNADNLQLVAVQEPSTIQDGILPLEQNNNDNVILIEDQPLPVDKNHDLVVLVDKQPPLINEKNDIVHLVDGEEPLLNNKKEDTVLLIEEPALVINNNEDQTTILKDDNQEKDINQDNILVKFDDTETEIYGSKFDTNEIVNDIVNEIRFLLTNSKMKRKENKIVYDQSKFKSIPYNDVIILMDSIPNKNYNFRGMNRKTRDNLSFPVRIDSKFSEKALSENKTFDDTKVKSK